MTTIHGNHHIVEDTPRRYSHPYNIDVALDVGYSTFEEEESVRLRRDLSEPPQGLPRGMHIMGNVSDKAAEAARKAVDEGHVAGSGIIFAHMLELALQQEKLVPDSVLSYAPPENAVPKLDGLTRKRR
jgi:hypothetical protein